MTGLDQNAVRKGLLDPLELLGHSDAQARYEHEVPTANVPAELICRWFEDRYTPEAPEFRAAFTAGELQLLAEFARYFASRLSLLPASDGVRDLQSSAAWRDVMTPAADAPVRIG